MSHEVNTFEQPPFIHATHAKLKTLREELQVLGAYVEYILTKGQYD